MEGKSYSLSRVESDYIEEVRKKCRLKSNSGALAVIIQQHRQQLPDIRRQEALEKLREATSILGKDLGIEREAILSWVAEVLGGVE